MLAGWRYQTSSIDSGQCCDIGSPDTELTTSDEAKLITYRKLRRRKDATDAESSC